MNPKEKLGPVMKVENDQQYLFLKYEADNLLKLFNYDFQTDSREELGHVKSKYDLSKVRNTKVFTQLIYTSTMPEKTKLKLQELINSFRSKFYKTCLCACHNSRTAFNSSIKKIETTPSPSKA
jgi:hypothetical protein